MDVDSLAIHWIIPGSLRQVVPENGPGEFDPYLWLATSWVCVLKARVVVELGVREGVSTRALLTGASIVDGHVWGVDLENQHNISDSRFTFIEDDAANVADRWESIDLLHIDTTPHTAEQTRRWFDLYAEKCQAIALHDTHHPDFRVGAAVQDFVKSGQWWAFEYWGNSSGWTVLIRHEG